MDPAHNHHNFIEGTVKVPGGNIWYKIVGADKKGIPLLTVHGGPGAPHQYLNPLQALANQRPVIFYDQLGCGRSDRPEDKNLWTVERFTEELDMLRHTLQLEKVHLLGQSWGSMLAVEYILRKKPSGIQSLILSGPYLSSPLWAKDQRNWIDQLPNKTKQTILKCEASEDFTNPAYQDVVMEFYKRHLCRMDPWPPELYQSMEQMSTDVYQYMWGPSEFTLTGTLKEADLTPQLPLLNLPVLLTCGQFDEAHPQTVALFKKLIPGARMHTFRGASHSHILEQPQRVRRTLCSFLRSTDS
ncbi:MAG TPA: proline iminopeptidase-family hydrolase [Desulfobacteraceae bacterium]|nr:proline iminopeptidase-family hydrolase [Desulfobacteraceae bacterium]HRW94565.1 proline iminopeptidase-family hydrolase [Bacteroidales bacterium]